MKKEAIIGLALAAVGTVLLVSKTKAEEPPPDEPGEGTIDIVIIGPDGQPLPQV